VQATLSACQTGLAESGFQIAASLLLIIHTLSGGFSVREIGEYLRKAREEKNISLKDVQESTKISMRYLEAIDRGDFNGIPGEVYRKGFIANYAAAIGLDSQDVLQRYHQIQSEKEAQQRQVQLEQAVIEKYNPTVSLRWSKEVYLTIATSLIGLLLIFSFIFPAAKENYVHKELSSRVKSESLIVDDDQTGTSPIEVDAVFIAPVWVSVKYDGNYLFGKDGRTFDATWPKQYWPAQKELEIEIGDPGGIKLSFKGKPLEKIGQKGKKAILKFDPHGLITP
jgi:transcriptional regulator with XRE-family HTH domain